MLPFNVMRQTITVLRKSGGSYDVNDRWVEGVETPIEHKYTSVQPASAEDLKMLPEGERRDGMILIWDKEELIASLENSAIESDIIVYDGRRYKVIMVNAWKTGILDHYEAIAELERNV